LTLHLSMGLVSRYIHLDVRPRERQSHFIWAEMRMCDVTVTDRFAC